MQESPLSSSSQSGTWERVIVPACSACQSFFWKLAWFSLFVAFVFQGRVPLVPSWKDREAETAVIATIDDPAASEDAMP